MNSPESAAPGRQTRASDDTRLQRKSITPAGEMLSAALKLAEMGYGVFPCVAGKKTPAVPRGFHAATREPPLIKKWWGASPRANVAIATEGLLVIDVDPEGQPWGAEHDADLTAARGVVITTPRGFHVWFRAPADADIRCSAGHLAPGVDVRSAGGYCLVPPSRTEHGEYVGELPPAADLADAPAWLLDLIAKPANGNGNGAHLPIAAVGATPYGRAALRAELEAVAVAREGARNTTTNKAAFALGTLAGADELDAAQAEAGLVAAAQVAGLPEREARKTVTSGLRAGLAHPRLPRTPANGAPPTGWADPLPLGIAPALPPFPVHALPDWLARWAEATAAATQTPTDLAGCLALATCAAACAGRYRVQARPGWTEPMNLFIAVVLPPGNRKSEVYRRALAPVYEVERELRDRAAPDIGRARAEYEVLEARLKAAKARAAKPGAASLDDVQELAAELASMTVPAAPRLVADDVTPEALGLLLADHGGRLLVASPEGGDVFALMAGRYDGRGKSNLETWLKSHAGDPLRVDRIGRPPVAVDHPALTTALAIQPDVLEGLSRCDGFRGRGLLARFLFSLPCSPVGRRAIRAPAVPHAVQAGYDARMRALLELGRREGEERIIPFEVAADDMLAAFEGELEPRLGADGNLAALTDWGSKLAGAVVRLAGVLHMADVGADDPGPVPATVVARAIALGGNFLAHALGAFQAMAADPAHELALGTLSWLRRAHPAEVSRRDVFDALRGRAAVNQVEDVDRPIDLLVEHGWLRPVSAPPRDGAGRPPSPRFSVHPKTYAEYAE